MRVTIDRVRPEVKGRRSEALRRKRRRQRRLQAALAVVVVLGLIAGLVSAFSGGDDDPGPTDVDVAKRTQQTMLVQIADSTGEGLSNILLAHDPDPRTGVALFVPPPVLATAPGSQPVPFQQVLRTNSPESSRTALGDLLGVTIDASWILDTPTAVALVDALGGVTVDVDVQVLGGPDGLQVLLPPGRQKLTGAQALTFATYRAPGEQEQGRLARLQGLLDGILAALPADDAQVVTLLGRLGPASQLSGIDTQGLANRLLALRDDSAADALQYDSVPVVTLETGAPQASLRLDTPAARALVDRLLAASVPPGVRATGNRVKVFNGVGTPMLGSVVRDRLVAANLVYVPGGNASTFGIAQTEIQIGDPTPEALALGRRVAAALGVPPTAVRTSDPTSVADVVVVIGQDFPH